MLNLSTPLLLSVDHELEHFNSGKLSLDDWLKKRALKNQASGASRCFVLYNDKKVIGYYNLSAGAISHESTPKTIRNMPDPLPVLLLGRLAIDRNYHNKGLGSALLRDAMLRAVSVAGDAGVFTILVHALSEHAKRYYMSRGFIESPLQAMTLFMTLKTLYPILAEPEYAHHN
ncbi:MAG: GNAT family N-acetyltransferase [Pseudomonadota bacterium]